MWCWLLTTAHCKHIGVLLHALSKVSDGLRTYETLSTTHDCYYYQVMGLLLVAVRHWCDFVVWTFKDLFVLIFVCNGAIFDLIYMVKTSYFTTRC